MRVTNFDPDPSENKSKKKNKQKIHNSRIMILDPKPKTIHDGINIEENEEMTIFLTHIGLYPAIEI